MLGQLYKEDKPVKLSDFYVSEKLDGMRAFWDGGSTVGRTDVPWSTERSKVASTGLWSRYGKVIHAPTSFTASLPPYFLDGELYLGRGGFQRVMSICKTDIPGPGWSEVKYHVFDTPPPKQLMLPGRINNNIVKEFIVPDCFVQDEWTRYTLCTSGTPFEAVCIKMRGMLKRLGSQCPHVVLVEQVGVPSYDALYAWLAQINEARGEGLMLRAKSSSWKPKRVFELLKIKPVLFGEGIVTGVTEGKGRLASTAGAAIVAWGEKTFKVSGFTDAERKNIIVGSSIRFKYRELTDEGLPKEGRYDRSAVNVVSA